MYVQKRRRSSCSARYHYSDAFYATRGIYAMFVVPRTAAAGIIVMRKGRRSTIAAWDVRHQQ